MPTRRFSLEEVNRMDRNTFVKAFGGVFEHSPWVAEAGWKKRPFAGVAELHEALRGTVMEAPRAARVALIKAHPDLVGKAALAGGLTPASTREQAGAGLDKLTKGEIAKFQDYNGKYRERFGFPFIICARLNKKEAILEAFPKRLKNSAEEEIETAVKEIHKIARFRLEDLVEAERKSAMPGRVTTHVLDTYHGRPAAGLKLELSILKKGKPHKIKSLRTNGNGRTDEPLLSGAEMKSGTYEILFFVDEYFRGLLPGLAKPPFLDRVPVHFGISDPSANYHVPLIATPWAYSTYRGS